jgi:hypothetical protein
MPQPRNWLTGMSTAPADTITDTSVSTAVGLPQVVQDIGGLEHGLLGIGVIEIGNGDPALRLL